MWCQYKAIQLICFLYIWTNYCRTILGDDVSIAISPQYVETNDTFTVSCTTNNADLTIISRNGKNCVLGCYIFNNTECDQQGRIFTVLCDSDTVVITVGKAMNTDFTTWNCSASGQQDSAALQEFEETSLTYKGFKSEIIEGEKHTFRCEASEGNPGALIEWLMNGKVVDDGIDQENETDDNTQTSQLIVTADRSMHTVQCVANQVHNKSPVPEDNKSLNIIYPPDRAVTTTPNVFALVGDTVRFECLVEGEGNPVTHRFNWTRKGDEDYLQVTDNGILEFNVTKVEDNTYYCTPENTVGPGKSATILLTVYASLEISSLTQLLNKTSAVMPLSFYVNTPGFVPICYTVWYHEDNGGLNGIVTGMPLSVADNKTATINIQDLVPNTTYTFVVRIDIKNASSNNLTISGRTRESQYVNIINGRINKDGIFIQWDYTEPPQDVEVTTCMEYWTESEGRETSKYEPPSGFCDVPVDNRILYALGNMKEGEVYHTYLHVYENGFPGTTYGEQWIDLIQHKEGLSSGDVAAITLSVLFSLFLLALIILIFLGFINIQNVYTCGGEDDDYEDDSSQLDADAYENTVMPQKSDPDASDGAYQGLRKPSKGTVRESQIELTTAADDPTYYSDLDHNPSNLC